MNHQTKTWNLAVALQTGATLIAGIAICTWLGGNVDHLHDSSTVSGDSAVSMAHKIAMPHTQSDRMMASSIKGKLDLNMDRAGNLASDVESDNKAEFETELKADPKSSNKSDAKQDVKQNAVKVRSAIFTLPVIKSGNGRTIHVQGVVS